MERDRTLLGTQCLQGSYKCVIDVASLGPLTAWVGRKLLLLEAWACSLGLECQDTRYEWVLGTAHLQILVSIDSPFFSPVTVTVIRAGFTADLRGAQINTKRMVGAEINDVKIREGS